MTTGDQSLLGRIVAGEYTVHSFLGGGAMGEVYAATSSAGCHVAIKFLRTEHSDDPDIVARFAREAKLARELRSDHVAAVLGSGVEADGRVWIAFERLIGETLDARMQREPIPISDLRWIIDGVLRGLADAHRQRIIHRDIKPANIFLETSGRARILDFGVSKLVRAEPSATTTGLTTAGDALGTANYMAPEQMQSAASVTPRADLYALGTVLFRLLTGRLPFEAQSYMELRACKLHDEPPSLAAVTGGTLHENVEGFLRSMIARRPEDRFASTEAAARAWGFAWPAITSSVTSSSATAADAPTIGAEQTRRDSGNP